MKRKIFYVLALLFCLLPIMAELKPMYDCYNSFIGNESISDLYNEQDGYAIVQGRVLHYWLYNSITNKSKHGGDTTVIYNHVVPKWVEKMGYVIDYDNMYVTYPNTALANSVRMLMKQRGADISVALVTDSKPHYALINEYFPSKNEYKFTYYPIYKMN